MSRFGHCMAVGMIAWTALLLLLAFGVLWPRPLNGRLTSAAIDWEQVLIRGKSLPELLETPTDRIRLFAYRGGFQPIPFQIDEVDESGRLVLPHGPAPQVPRGRLGGRDELLILAGSIGQKATPDTPPPCPGTVAVAIGRQGDVTPQGWIYAAVCPESMPKATEDFAHLDPATGRTETPDFRLSFNAGLPFAPESMVFDRRHGGTGQDLLDGISVEGHVKLLGGLVQIKRVLKDFRAEVAAWKDGSIRVIRRSPTRARTVGDHYTNPGTFSIDSVLAPGHLAFDVLLQTRHDISAYLNDMLMTVAWNFQGFEGMELRFPGSPVTARVDGVISGREATLKRDVSWIYASGSQGSFIGRMVYAPGLPVLKSLYYREYLPGRLELGFQLSRLQQLAKGRTVFRAEIIHIPGGSYAEASSLMATRARPLSRIQ